MTRFLIAFALMMIAPPVPAPLAANKADLDRVAEHLLGVASMTAGFVQTDRAGKALSGQMTLKRPGKIRFQYEKGVPLLIVSDGKALTLIDYQVRQVQRWPIGNSPLAVLLDPKRDIGRIARVVDTADPRILLVEARDPKKPQYGTLTLAFARNPSAPAGLMLQGWIALDAQNNRTTVRLSDQRFNVAVPDSAFRWQDPRRSGNPR